MSAIRGGDRAPAAEPIVGGGEPTPPLTPPEAVRNLLILSPISISVCLLISAPFRQATCLSQSSRVLAGPQSPAGSSTNGSSGKIRCLFPIERSQTISK